MFLYCRMEKCFCLTYTHSCSIYYKHNHYYVNVEDMKSTKIESPSQSAVVHAFVCHDPRDENAFLCERWNLSIRVCADSFSLCQHRWKIQSCAGTPSGSIRFCRLGNSNSLFVNQSVIDMCRYGFTVSVLTSKTTTSFTTDPLTTPESTNTTESEKSEGATLDNIKLSITFWVHLCSCIIFVIIVISLVLFSCHEQNMRSQSKGLSAIEPEKYHVINNSVYGYNVNPPSAFGEYPNVSG